MTFLPAPLKAGSTEIEVQLFDSGGITSECSESTPQDHSALKRFKVLLVTTELLPQLYAVGVIDVDENLEHGAGLTIFNYFGNSFAAPTIPAASGNVKLIADVDFELFVYAPMNFEGDIGVPQMNSVGTLTFAPAYGFYGDSVVAFRLISTSGRSTPWTNFTIRVHPINQAPAFKLRQETVQVLEDSTWMLPFRQHHFAFNISKGLFPEASELGVYYSDSLYRSNEAYQQLNFELEIIEGNQQLFDALALSPNGTLTFKLAANENGHARIRVRLIDDGGTQGVYDQDTSQPLVVTVFVTPVNDAPIFLFEPSIVLLEQNESYVHSSSRFTLNWFWSDFLGNFQGPENELYQNLTFTFEKMSGTTIVFDSAPILSMNGVVALHIGAYSWGQTVLSFSAHDDGGTEFWGHDTSSIQNFTLQIMPINTRPTIGMPLDVYMWVDPYTRDQVAQENAFMVVEKCCSPCPGPQPCGPIHEVDESCGCFAPNQLGSMYTELRLNSSAGPYEDKTQILTFTIFEVGTSGLIDNLIPPHINPDGSLVLKLKQAAVGVADFEISVQDDGGLEDLPHQTAHNSRVQRTRLHILTGFVPLNLQVQTFSLQRLGIYGIRQQVASVCDVDTRMVIATSYRNTTTCVDSTCAGTCYTNCITADGWLFPNYSHCTSRCLLPSEMPHEVWFIELQVVGSTIESLFQLQGKLQSQIQNKSWADAIDVGHVQSRASNEPDPKPPRFTVPKVIIVDEGAVLVQDIVTGVQVDGALWKKLDEQWILSSVQLLRTKAPATLSEWDYGSSHSNMTRIVNQSQLALEFRCDPYCHSASLQLRASTDIHGIVELLITIQSLASGLKTSSKVHVVFQPVPDAPEALGPVTILEDGGFCLVQACRSRPVHVPAYSFIVDRDEWFRGGNRLFVHVASGHPSKLNASIEEGNIVRLILQPGLHVHGTFNVSIFDGDGLTSFLPLSVIVEHVNHPPYLEHLLPNITLSEDSIQRLLLSDYFTDVDMIDQQDSLVLIDFMIFSVRTLTPVLLQGTTSAGGILTILPLHNMHGAAALTLIATDSQGANVSAKQYVNILPIPDRPFVQRLLPEAPNGTLWVVENSHDLRINLSYVFGDVDNCSTLIVRESCMYGPAAADRLFLSANSTRPWKVNATIEGEELVLSFVEFEHSHSNEDIVVSVHATDAFGLEAMLSIIVYVEPVNTIPYAVLKAVHMIENQAPLLIHLTTAEATTGSFAFIDEDSYSNFEGDSLRFEVQISEPDLLEARVLTQGLHNASGASAEACVFPFVFQDSTGRNASYSNCTTAGTGLDGPRGYQSRFSWCSLRSEFVGDVQEGLDRGVVGKCRFQLELVAVAGHFGRSQVVLSAFDSWGGVGVGTIDVAVSMINDPPVFTVPTLFEVNSVSTLTGSETTEIKHFAIIRSLGFQESTPDIPSPEDFCRVQPVRLQGDCQSLPPILCSTVLRDQSAHFAIAMILALDMTRNSFDDRKQYFFVMGIAKAAGVETSYVTIKSISEEQIQVFRRRSLLATPRLIVDVEISAGDMNTAKLVSAQLTPRNLNAQLLSVGMESAEMVSTPIIADMRESICNMTKKCSGHGQCDKTGACQCSKAFEGQRCDVSTNMCPAGFTGTECGSCLQDAYQQGCNSSCTTLRSCSGHGRCRGSGACQCYQGWKGHDCSMSFNDANGCSDGFAGPMCFACLQDAYQQGCNNSCSSMRSCSGHGETCIHTIYIHTCTYAYAYT